jgi:hypothetical protein
MSKEQSKERSDEDRWSLRNKLALISTIFSGLSWGFAIGALMYSVSTQYQMKNIDLLIYFQKRYDDVAYDMKGRVGKEYKPEDYYHRFWDLQFEQYQYWRLGLIRQDIYSSWMGVRLSDWKRDEDLGGMKYRQGWEEAQRYLSNGSTNNPKYYDDFVKFMNAIHDGHTEVYINGP